MKRDHKQTFPKEDTIRQDSKEDAMDAEKGKDTKTAERDAKMAELTETVQRLQAQYENAQKRADKESAIKVDKAEASLLLKMLPLIDAFDAALKHAKDAKEHTAIKILADQAQQILLSIGITPMETVGKRFDADLHEAMMVEEQKGKDHIILEEFQKGYLYHAKVLRHAKVKVGKDQQDKAHADSTNEEGHSNDTSTDGGN